MERKTIFEKDLMNLKDTELRLGLPGSREWEKQSAPAIRKNKRALPEQTPANESTSSTTKSSSASISHVVNGDQDTVPQSKAQVIGWPPVRSYRRHSLSSKQEEKGGEVDGGGTYVKVSMDGAPYLRKMDLKLYCNYAQLLMALENMFQFKIGKYCEKEGFDGPEFAPTYEDKDGDWMLVGDVPWEMFIGSCRRLRIMKGSEARGLGCL